MRKTILIISCEHGGNKVPKEYSPLFANHHDLLAAHRGWDIGAAQAAKYFAKRFEVDCHIDTTTRLLVELNRSIGHKSLFSSITRSIDPSEKEKVIARYYYPYRTRLENAIAAQIAGNNRVFHLSVHSFTPELDGQKRTADIGLLYDPRRKWEKEIAQRWCDSLSAYRNDLIVRRNYPYLGISDGLTTYLRKRFSEACYAGIELEINQKFPLGPTNLWTRTQKQLGNSIESLLLAIS